MAAHTAVNQALELHYAGRNPAAKQVLVRALQRDGRNADLLRAAVELGIAMNEPAFALNYAERLVTLAPAWPDAWLLRAQVDVARQKPADAVAFAQRALDLEPANPDRHRALAWVLHRAHRYRDAERAAAAGLALAPADDDLWQKRAVAIQQLGRLDEAWAVYEEALSRCPRSVVLAESIAMLSNYRPEVRPAESLALHRRFGALLAEGVEPAPPPARVVGADEPVRVGLLSPDLRGHSVGVFADAIIRHHDPERLHLFAYDTHGVEDAVMRRFRGALGPRWRSIEIATPDRVDAAIRADRLDLLIELSGLTRDHQLQAIVGKPAPRVATFIGYPNTTGLAAIDFRLVDAMTDPPGVADQFASERLIRLDPCFLCYTPPEDAPPVTWEPAAGRRAPVFASFNRMTKVTDAQLRAWASLLARVPEAELHLKSFGLEDDAVREDVLTRCAAAGLPPARLKLVAPVQDKRGHLDAYNRVDVALDTFPYHGTTTTCEALLMGVPVITIEGDRHAARVGVSLLNAAGVQELITQSPEQTIELAADLIRDQPRLAGFRRGLRERLLASPLCDGPAYARGFERACRAMVNG